MPTITGGMPSIRNSHCQPCSPAKPESLVITSPETGPPTMPETAIARMNIDMIRARSAEGNQRVR